MNIGDDRPQARRVGVGTGVNVGVTVGRSVAVLVAVTVGIKLGVAVLPGELQPARKERSNIQEMSRVFCRLRKWDASFIEILSSIQIFQE